jgi:chromosome segregation ATPase
MMDDTLRRLSQLVEINRNLADDLDASRRAAASAERQRDRLQAEVESLRAKVSDLKSQDISGQLRREVKKMASELLDTRQELERILREREAISADIEAARARVRLADQRLRAGAEQLRRVEQERDDLRQQLEESFLAMDEIKRRLALNVEETSLNDGVN